MSIWFAFWIHAFVSSLFFFFFFFLILAPLALFIEHEQCIKANEQCFVSVNSNQKLFFYCFQFSVFSKISGIQTHTKSSKALLLCSFQIIQIGNNGMACKRTPDQPLTKPSPQHSNNSITLLGRTITPNR